MSGEDPLAELLALARRQSEALAADDLTEFDRLADQREPLVTAVEAADWTDRQRAEQVACDLLACDEQNKAVLRRRVATVAQELAATRRMASALHGYNGLAETTRQTPLLLDRSA